MPKKTRHIEKEIQITSFCAVDPLQFIEFKRPEIMFKLTNQLGCSDGEAASNYNFLTEVLIRLRELRGLDKSLTNKYLDKTVYSLDFAFKFFMINYLLKAITSEYTYCHAFHSMAQEANLDLAFPIVPVPVTDHDLLVLLNKEKASPGNSSAKDSSAGIKTFRTFLTAEQLMILRSRLIRQKIIGRITEPDFLHLFTEQPVLPAIITLMWNESRGLCHEFLSRVVYNNSRFKYKQANSCISFKDGRKLDSNDKSRAQYKNSDILDQILQF